MKRILPILLALLLPAIVHGQASRLGHIGATSSPSLRGNFLASLWRYFSPSGAGGFGVLLTKLHISIPPNSAGDLLTLFFLLICPFAWILQFSCAHFGYSFSRPFTTSQLRGYLFDMFRGVKVIPIQSAFLRRNPTNISRFIDPIVVDTIDVPSRLRLGANVLKKGLEGRNPPRAYSYSSSPISMKTIGARVVTTLFHISPSRIFRSRFVCHACIVMVFGVVVNSSFSAEAQASRMDWNVQTINSSAPQPGGQYPVLAIPNSVVHVCSAPANAVPCTNYATTYASASGSACTPPAQFTRDNSTTCVANADAQGGWGVWMDAGNYQYTITTTYGSFGPYDFSIGGGRGGRRYRSKVWKWDWCRYCCNSLPNG